MAEKEKTKADEGKAGQGPSATQKPKGEESKASQDQSAAQRTNVTEISTPSISALGSKLDKFSENLTEEEQVILATVFALASRGFLTFPGPVSCVRDLRVGIGQDSISVERAAGSSVPKLSEALADAFQPGKTGRFAIEGMEVEKSMFGAKSVAARGCRNPGLMASKSVAAQAFCRNPGLMASKSVAAAAFCRNPGLMASKSVAARGCRNPGLMASKSVAAQAFCRNPGLMASKSVAARACRTPGFAGAKSVAAQAFCRNPGLMASKSVAAARFCRNPGLMASKSVAFQ